MSAGKPEWLIETVANATVFIEVLADFKPRTHSEVVAHPAIVACGIKSTPCLNYLRTLESCGYVRQDELKRWSLSLRFASLAVAYQEFMRDRLQQTLAEASADQIHTQERLSRATQS
jgi:DNA-binding IclR family transcriptional regulator